MRKMTLKKNVKKWLRARILALLGAFGAAQGVPRASQDGPKSCGRVVSERFVTLWGALGHFFTFLVDFFAIFGRFLVDFCYENPLLKGGYTSLAKPSQAKPSQAKS